MSPADPSDRVEPGLDTVERMTTSEVLALARISRATLWRRINEARLPRPVDCGRQSLFLRRDVIAALTIQPSLRSHTEATEKRLEMLRRRRQKKGA